VFLPGTKGFQHSAAVSFNELIKGDQIDQTLLHAVMLASSSIVDWAFEEDMLGQCEAAPCRGMPQVLPTGSGKGELLPRKHAVYLSVNAQRHDCLNGPG
jgi:hypothetical protein